MNSPKSFWFKTTEVSMLGNEPLKENERWNYCEEALLFVKEIEFKCYDVPDGYELMFVSNSPYLNQIHSGFPGVSIIRKSVMSGNVPYSFAYLGKRFQTLTFPIEGI
jgi:hypothetical protein